MDLFYTDWKTTLELTILHIIRTSFIQKNECLSNKNDITNFMPSTSMFGHLKSRLKPKCQNHFTHFSFEQIQIWKKSFGEWKLKKQNIFVSLLSTYSLYSSKIPQFVIKGNISLSLSSKEMDFFNPRSHLDSTVVTYVHLRGICVFPRPLYQGSPLSLPLTFTCPPLFELHGAIRHNGAV